MSELHFHISQIRPSDVPRRDSWLSAQEKVLKTKLSSPLKLSDLNIDLYRIGKILTVPNGNHFLAAILHILGDLESVAIPVNPAHYNTGQWIYQLQRVQSEGIMTFDDYLRRIDYDF